MLQEDLSKQLNPIMKILKIAAGIGCVYALTIGFAQAQNIVLDEFGNGWEDGIYMPGNVMADPTGRSADPVLLWVVPGGLPIQGDIWMYETPDNPSETISDVISAFNNGGNGYLVFYSLGEEGGGPYYEPYYDGTLHQVFADISPESFANVLQYPLGGPGSAIPIQEQGTEGGENYGFIDFGSGTLTAISDVPEPTSLTLLGLGGLVLLWRRRS